MPTVVTEVIAEAPTRMRRPLFNCDFVLHFVDWRTFSAERTTAVCSVLPNAIGAELFLVMDKDTLTPTALELSGGDAFSIKYFTKYIQLVEASIRAAVCQFEGIPEIARKITEAASVQDAALARILIVEDATTFLYFPVDTIPTMRGERLQLALAADQHIQCYIDNGEIVCFDGWVKTECATTELMLIAVQEQAKMLSHG